MQMVISLAAFPYLAMCNYQVHGQIELVHAERKKILHHNIGI